MKILFVVDGNNKIGMGHVYRSINLAKEFKKNRHDVVFLTKEIPSKKIISSKFECKFFTKLNQNSTKIFIQNFSPHLIILDKLNETKLNLNILHKFCPIVSIDYRGKNSQLIDLGLNILYPKSGTCNNCISSFNYAIIDNQFHRYRKKTISKKIKSILILQGGADTYCFIPKIIKSISTIDQNFKINVVIGPSFNCWQKLNKILKSTKKPVKIYQNTKNIASIMIKSDLAITAAGNTLLELSYLGIPSLVICAEKFELETANLLQKQGFGINAGFGKNLTNSKIKLHMIELIISRIIFCSFVTEYPLRTARLFFSIELIY